VVNFVCVFGRVWACVSVRACARARVGVCVCVRMRACVCARMRAFFPPFFFLLQNVRKWCNWEPICILVLQNLWQQFGFRGLVIMFSLSYIVVSVLASRFETPLAVPLIFE
jgi:hypothetical protein